ncbi:MAG: hypothetical protein J6W00_15030 [Lentisphaeria bacterium]|nr:hypothetical protein [Lentisphaeria bacterium]
MENSIPTDRKVEIAQALIERAVRISDNTDHDVFIEWSPHVNSLYVRFCRDGWAVGKPYTGLDIDFDLEADTEGGLANVNTILDSLEGDK